MNNEEPWSRAARYYGCQNKKEIKIKIASVSSCAPASLTEISKIPIVQHGGLL